MSRTSYFWLLISVVGITMILLVVRDDPGTIAALADSRTAQVIFLVLILALAVFGLGSRGPLGRTVRNGLIWGVLAVGILVAYSYRVEIGQAAQRVMGELVPGTAIVETDTAGGDTVVITRRAGHFSVVARVNNASLSMMVDTGASVVTLTAEDARLVGIPTRTLAYNYPVATANGTAYAARVVLTSVAVGPIERRRVEALVAQPGMLETSLLGMNFVNTLSSFTISGSRMELVP